MPDLTDDEVLNRWRAHVAREAAKRAARAAARAARRPARACPGWGL